MLILELVITSRTGLDAIRSEIISEKTVQDMMANEQSMVISPVQGRASSPRQLLAADELAMLNERSNLKGGMQLAKHLAVMAASGIIWATQMEHWWLALPALVVYGFSLAAMFATVHECGHRTAFANNRVNDVVAWWAGVLSFYNSTFYRRYHKWHHRFTQIPGKDPELDDPKPASFKDYVVEVSAIPWWMGKVKTHTRIAMGHVQNYPFLPESAYGEVIRSTRWQLAVYSGAIALSILAGHPWAVLLYWVLPMAVGQPLLRAILLAEHTGCTEDENPFTNTRTTLTMLPVRLLMWNMPYHAEHHLYPSMPFHALPAAYGKLSQHWQQVEHGYVTVNRKLVNALGKAA
ncbi:fatty acid desaturase family protein [Leptolyngbya sp. AN02str]|uniref:fatty acid desaturase family protein n=1 Tax=Leptolyngbya sp. AN02str TaxID=3423363 RepID=UPI003D312A4A